MKRLERLKSWDGIVATLGLALCLGVVLTGCSDDVTEPDTAQAQAATTVTEVDEEAADRERLQRLGELGIEIDGSRGVFALGFGERFNPRDETTDVRGGAHAIVFSEPFDPGAEDNIGIDVGSVSVRSPSAEYELYERSGKLGVRYTTRLRRTEGQPTNVDYVAGGTYTYEVSGSEDFAPTSFEVTAPAALIDITSPTHREEVDPGADLTVEWSGGSDGRVLFMAMAPSPRMQGRRGQRGGCSSECNGQHQGRHGGRGGPGPSCRGDCDCGEGCRGGGTGHGYGHGPGGRPPIDDSQVYREVLESNDGQFTLSSETIQTLLAASGSDRLMIHVGQAIATDVEHDSDTLVAVVRTGDRVGVKATLTQ